MAIPNDVWRAAGMTAVGLIVGGSLLVWPNYRESRQVNMRLELLQDRVSKLDPGQNGKADGGQGITGIVFTHDQQLRVMNFTPVFEFDLDVVIRSYLVRYFVQ